MGNDSLSDRMKEYENVAKTRLTRRCPVIGRLDGRAFHTLTRGMNRPWDENFITCMDLAASALCEELQGVKVAYVQSDEISVLLTDYDTIQTQAWLNYEMQKMCSIAASIATAEFNRAHRYLWGDDARRLATFDARFFSLPEHEVVNYFIWRQQDAVRNSIQMLAQSKFSHKQLHQKDTKQMQEMLFQEHGINWNDTATYLKRGRCVVRTVYTTTTRPHEDEPEVVATRHRWDVDNAIPKFTEVRDYIERFVRPDVPSEEKKG